MRIVTSVPPFSTALMFSPQLQNIIKSDDIISLPKKIISLPTKLLPESKK